MTDKKKLKPIEKVKVPVLKLETSKSAGEIRQAAAKQSVPVQATNKAKATQAPAAPNLKPSDAQFRAFANIIYDQVGLGRLIDQLNLVERSLFKDKQGLITIKSRDYLTGSILNVFQEIEKAGLEPEDDQKQLQYLKDLTEYLLALPVVKVTIAFEPTHSFVMNLNNQISATIGKKVILEMIIDEDVIGGAIFEYRGKMSEQTLKNKLHDSLVGLVEKAYMGKQLVSDR